MQSYENPHHHDPSKHHACHPLVSTIRVGPTLSIHCWGDNPALLVDVPTAVAAGVGVPSLASPLAARPSSVDACTAADLD